MANTIKSLWEPANVKTAEAYYLAGHLILVVTGDMPAPCYTVRIDNPADVEPPLFIVEWRPGRCPQVITPYRKTAIFFIGAYREKVDVASAEGTKSVAVKKLFPLAGEAEAAEAAEAEKKFPERIATGYSSTFSFEEAFRNAIAQLPPRFPDELQQFVVIETGALIGGITGLQELYVTVRTSTS